MVPGWPWPRARRPRHLCRFMARRRWRRAGDLPCRECRSQHRRRVLGGPGEREGCSAGHGGLCLRCLPHVGGVSRVPQIAGTRATPDDGGTPSDQTPPAVHPTTELELPHHPQSSWGRATPQGHPKRFVPLAGNTQPVLAACGCHPSWAAIPWGSSAVLGGLGRSIPRPLWVVGADSERDPSRDLAHSFH